MINQTKIRLNTVKIGLLVITFTGVAFFLGKMAFGGTSFDSSSGILPASDGTTFSPTNRARLSAWVRPRWMKFGPPPAGTRIAVQPIATDIIDFVAPPPQLHEIAVIVNEYNGFAYGRKVIVWAGYAWHNPTQGILYTTYLGSVPKGQFYLPRSGTGALKIVRQQGARLLIQTAHARTFWFQIPSPHT